MVPGRLLIACAAAGAAGLGLGAARETLAVLLALLLVLAAIAVAVRGPDAAETPPVGAPLLRRSLFVAGFGLAGLLAAPYGPVGAAAVAALLAIACVAERLALPGPGRLEIARELPARLMLGTPNEIALRIRNLGTVPLHVDVRDRAPWGLHPSRQPAGFSLPPGRTAVHRYDVTPSERGAYRFEAVDLRLTRSPGLLRRMASVPLPGETHVYPNVRDAARVGLLLHRRRTPLLGIKPARVRGKGTEFDALREYQTDDEFRDISWKASARAGKLLVQTYQVERSQNVMILVEAGRMMSAAVTSRRRLGLSKLDHAVGAALVLAQTACLKEDRVGLLAFNESVRAFLPPKRGRAQVAAIVDGLHDLEPSLCEPDFGAAFQQLKSKAKRRSLVALFTDLLDDESARRLLETLPLLTPQHLPLVIALSDPSLAEIAGSLPTTGQQAFEGAVAEDLLQERREILRRLRARGAMVLDVPPHELSTAVVNRYLEIKARNLL